MLLYAFTIFLGAFLLFQVELVIAKYILPWFGGVPAVWNTCLLFFQALLMGGYAYAHWVVSRLGARRQGALQVVLLACSLCFLAVQVLAWGWPLLPTAWWKPISGELPVLRVLAVLAASIGVPFFVLSTTSSLLQAWFARTRPGRSPYPLYALSNAGSLLGLLTYPFLVEPALSLRAQAGVWSGGYVVFAGCFAWCAIRAGRPGLLPAAPKAPAPSAGAGVSIRPGWRQRLLWLGLSACASVLLLGTTNQMSEEVAAIPFLWVLPLSLYLLSFIFCFGSKRAYSRRLFVPASVVAVVLIGVTMRLRVVEVGFITYIWIYSLPLFVGCMICHGELARLRPGPRYLTSFYLILAVGAAAGGAFVAVIAPRVFDWLWEVYVGYFGCGVLLLIVMLGDGRSRVNGRWRWLWRPVIGLVLAALVVGSFWQAKRFRRSAVIVRRNFYGIVRVLEKGGTEHGEGHRYVLYHAQTLHGNQYTDPALRKSPACYYGESSGIGLAIRNHPRRGSAGPGPGRGMHIGVIGLGAGTLAAYGRAGDRVRFYEINPVMIELSAGPAGPFTYLRDSLADITVVPGDGRVSLERELAWGEPQRFDVLALDAFSGDAPPIHLLTREAFQLYLQHLREGGVLAIHISNRHISLEPVVWRAAREFGLGGVLIVSKGDQRRTWPARWVLLTRDAAFLLQKNIVAAASPRDEGEGPIRLWTDDFSNLLQTLD